MSSRSSLPALLYLDLLGAPFVEGGRGPSGYDCVGLAMEVARRRGCRLPAYLSDITELHRQLAAGGILEEAQRIAEPEPGCVVLLRVFGGLGLGTAHRHLGTMLNPWLMLHTQRQTGAAVIERLHQPLWERRVLGFYRVPAAVAGEAA